MYGLLLVVTEHATSECECDRHTWQWRIPSTHPSFDTFSVSEVFLVKCVFRSLYSHEHSDFKTSIHTSVCVNVWYYLCCLMSWDAMTCCLTCVCPYIIACASWCWPAPSHSCVTYDAWGARLSVAVVADIGGEGRVDHCVCICMWTIEYGCGKLTVDLCCVLWRSLQACTPNKPVTKHTHDCCVISWGGTRHTVRLRHVTLATNVRSVPVPCQIRAYIFFARMLGNKSYLVITIDNRLSHPSCLTSQQ